MFLLLVLAGGAFAPAWATNATTTTLAVKSAGSAVTTVTAGSVVTLTGSVILAGNPVTTGQVAFCNAAATHCTDINLLGTAQLTLTGTASISFIPAIGSFSYKAVFIPSGSHAGSASSASALTVTGTGTYPTTTSFTSVDSLGNYLFTATVTGMGSLLAAPTGTVSFLDTSNSNAALATATLGPSTAGVTYTNPATPAVGYIPYGIVTADFNGDGIPDFATANYDADTVTIELGNGDGTFSQVNSSPATANSPYSLVAGDFNGDGKVDLAVTNYGSASVTILLGNGNGTFSAAASPETGSHPQFLTLGDFNEDGNQDLAVSNYIDGTVTILLGNGNGTFTAAGSSPSVGSDPQGIAAGDFNNDGHLDLAVASGSNVVQILLGAGDGSFTTGATPAVGDYPQFLAVGDFNADGNADLAVVNVSDGTVTVLMGDGTGAFTANATSPVTGEDPSQVAVADFNQDGIADLAVANDVSPGTVTVLLGHGDGTFAAVTPLPTAVEYFYGLAVADYNGDGVPDIAAMDYDYSKVAVLLTGITETATATAITVTPTPIGTHNVEASYAGSSTTTASVSSTLPILGVAATTTSLVVSSNAKPVSSVAAGTVVTLTATVNGLTALPSVRGRAQNVHPNEAPTPSLTGQVNFCDATASDCLGIHRLGTAQVTTAGTASMSYVPGIGSHSYKAVFLVDYYGSGTESSVQSLTVTGGYPTATTIASSGSAGKYTLTATVTGETNLAVPVGGTVSFLDMSNSSGLLGTATLSSPTTNLSFVPSLTAATGEYPQAVATADFNGDGYADAVVVNVEDETITVLLGKGNGTFNSVPNLYVSGYSAVVGDWNGDGIPDLAITGEGDTVKILLGNGDGTFTAGTAPSTGSDSSLGATADFNGDGNADIAVTNYDGDTLTILLGNGDGTFTAAASASTGDYPYGLTVADFNGDNRPDIAVSSYDDSTVTILLGNGDGTFTAAPSSPATGTYPYLIVSGDFNGDGKPDLAVSNFGDNALTILLGKGDGTFTAAASPATGNGPYAMAIADLNRDGKTDLAVANYDDDTITILLGNGDGTFTASTALPTTGVEPYAMAVADLNGDGLPDLMVPNYGNDTMTVLLTQLQEGAQATLTHVSPLGTGTHNVEASYPATAPYGASVSSTTPLVAGVGGSALTLTANPASAGNFGDQVVLTATLSPFAPEGVSTNGETITFYNGTTSVGTGTLAGGVATLTLTSLPIGSDSLTAVYPGDANLGTSTSSAVTFTVSNNALTFTLSGGTAATTIASGGTATFAFGVTPGSSSTFGANVTFAVTGAPSGMTATFNPTSITAGSGATTVTLTMTMAAASVQRHVADVARRLSPLALGMLLLPFAGRLRRSGKRLGGLMCLLLALCVVGGMMGCGGSSTPVTPTPAAQTYTMTVTAMSGSVSKSTTLTLTVN